MILHRLAFIERPPLPDIVLRLAKRLWLPTLFALFVLIFWALGTWVFEIPEYLFPSPISVARAMINDRDYYLAHSTTTLVEALCGFAVAVITGFLMGTIFALFGTLERMLLPYAIASQAVPIVAVAPLFILWMGNGLPSKIAMATLICFFPMVVNTTRGLRAVGKSYLALMHVYNASEWQIYWKLRFPYSLPYVLSGMKVSAALAMIGAIVAEYSGADRGLGYVITQSTYRSDTVQLFAGIIYSAIGGLLIFLIVVLCERMFLERYLKQI